MPLKWSPLSSSLQCHAARPVQRPPLAQILVALMLHFDIGSWRTAGTAIQAAARQLDHKISNLSKATDGQFGWTLRWLESPGWRTVL